MSSPVVQPAKVSSISNHWGRVATCRRGSAGLAAALAAALLAMLAWVAPVAGQAEAEAGDDGAAAQVGEPTIELDLEALLKHDDVLPEQIATPAWLIEPNAGRRLIALPLKVTAAADTAELGASPSLSLRGGRFLMWRIEPAAADDRRSQRVEVDEYGRPVRRAADRRASENDTSLPEGAPRLARRITIQPDGRVQWGLERSLPNAALQDGEQLYILRIRPERLRELQPGRPERVQRGGSQDRAQMARQRREAERAHREQQRAFGQLRSEVMALPDTFEVEAPARIWAIYEIAEAIPDLSLEGDEPPLPWSIRLEDFQTLRSLAGAGRRRGGLDQFAIEALRRAATADHPLSNRLAAYGAIEAGLIDQMEPHDTLYNVLQAILESEDETARRTVLTALVETRQPTTATLSLLRHASSQADPQMKLISLRGMLRSDPREADSLAQMVRTTNEVLVDSDGPDPAMVLAELVEAVGDQGEDVVNYVAANLSFDRLSADRLEAATRYIVVAAGEHPLAAAWLDRQLLGSANPNLVEQTLEVIAAADTGSPWAREAARRGIAALFGPSTADDDDSPAALALGRRIPIHSTSHALFRSLNSGHSRVRELAWRSLGNFEFVSDNQRQRFRRPPGGAGDDEQITVYSELVAAALGQSPTPSQAVPFLRRQTDPWRAAAATLRLLLEADEAASAQAARALVGSGWEIGSVLTEMPADKRAEAARLLYEHLTGETPLVTALLAHAEAGRRGRGNLVEWFGQRVAEGALPLPGEWTEPFRNDADLLAIAGSDDSQQAAGAVAALVYAAGGDDLAVQEQVDRFAELAGTDQAQLASAWASARQDIYTRRLSASQGSYRMVALVHVGRAREDAAGEAAQRLTLGVVDLQVDGRSISLSNDIVPVTLADDELAIRIERVHALQGFRNDALDELALEEVREPLDLSPQPDGSWVGSVPMRDDRRLEVRLEPVQ